MAVPTITVPSLTTGDRDPSNAPYRSSLVASTFTVNFLITSNGIVGYYHHYIDGGTSTRLTRPFLIKQIGALCGVSRCGLNTSQRKTVCLAADGAGAGVFNQGIGFSFIGAGLSAEGDYKVGIDVRNEDGWNTD